ncbi:polysaccharide deacetylase family protein [Neorhizobium sp. JUb45]|uniref:polysaccharide deacetylase family protein n=1 Tax=unclassified Neorhizobium TaxID=2629175 RepID=UPI0010465AEC|nr:polysaccharide deacetylase family protein [Neorhizobium sp. JUb45]TCR04461.1 peptidoglycan/xylan/chitin deacetylase (PgdA/CDA1 family) [Neorhizobium sp. JUb45]
MPVRVLCAAAAFACLLSSCAGKPPSEGGSLKSAFAAGNATGPLQTKDDAKSPVALTPAAWGRMSNPRGLAGRDLTVTSLSDIKLRDKEVVLTFDDGPVPKKTERILATLDDFHVKATFLMVGEMAKAYPKIARQVVDAGHTIGSHTFRHADLRKLAVDEAIAEINRGRDAVRAATRTDANFFRFPYLSDSGTLRHWVAQNRMVVLDVQIDSKDYFGVSPAAVATRTMADLRRHGRGIILMHDIHNRTASMLPALLTQLKAEGYKVVSLRYGGQRGPLLSAAAAQDAAFNRS